MTGTGFLFKRPDGLPFRVDTVGDVFARVLDTLVIPPFRMGMTLDRAGRTPYCLRHSANTRMRTLLGDAITQAIMGHLTDAMTRRYDDPDEAELLARIGRGEN